VWKSGSKAAVNGEKWMVDGSESEQERELAIPCLLSLITHHFPGLRPDVS